MRDTMIIHITMIIICQSYITTHVDVMDNIIESVIYKIYNKKNIYIIQYVIFTYYIAMQSA